MGHAVILGLVVQGHQGWGLVVALGPERCDVSTAQAAGLHMANCIVLGEHCRGSAVAGRAAGVLSDAPGCSGWGPGQAVVTARAAGVHALGCKAWL